MQNTFIKKTKEFNDRVARRLKGIPMVSALGLMLFLGIAQPAHATWLNFGDGHDGNKTVSGTEYTNDIMYPVTNYTVSGSSAPYTITITISGSYAASGTGGWNSSTNSSNQAFQINDRILIVDLSVASTATTRNYDLAIISAISYNSGTNTTTITATAAATSYVHTSPNYFDVATGSKTWTQVMKVNQWQTVDFNSGAKLTCHPWDPVTGMGGILAFNASVKLKLDVNGTVDASGMGPVGADNVHTSGVAGTRIGSAGSGGPITAQDGTSGSGSPLGLAYPGNGGISMSDCLGNLIAGGNGGCGTGAFDGTGPFPGTRPHDFPSPSKANGVMSFNAGLSGLTGQGPGSGGNGGGGGSGSVAGTGGNLGTQAVGAGGWGKSGGTGGGLIYIKCYEIVTNYSSRGVPVLISTGTAGTGGISGTLTVFGNGGAGGPAGNGGCSGSSYIAPGGGGAGGQGGNGADGGGGGNGGPGGGIWIGANIYTTLATHDFNASGGAGGSGSSGTPASINGPWGADGSTASVCAVSCGCSAGILKYVSTYPQQAYCTNGSSCNDVQAFTILSGMTAKIPFGSGWKYTTPAASATEDPRDFCIWDPTFLTLTAYTWVPGAGSPTCSSPIPTGSLHVYTATFASPCSLTFWGAIAMPTGTIAGPVINWVGAGSYNTSNHTLTDGSNFCTLATCGGGGDPSTDCVRPCPGKPGPPGDPGPSGEADVPSASEPTNSSSSDPSHPDFTEIQQIPSNDLGLRVVPNPSSYNTTIHFNVNNGGAYTLVISDIAGKELLRKTISAMSGDNQYMIDVKTYPVGEYNISIGNNISKQQIKFIKN